jgi:endo-1,4-beta-xylanase
MKYLITVSFYLTVLLGSTTAQKAASLKESFKPFFLIGAALNVPQIEGKDLLGLQLVEKNFNTISPENILKWRFVQPGPAQYDFKLPDQYVALGKKNNMFIVGHTLVWHSQLSPYVESITDPTQMEQALKEHIHHVMGRYKGRIHGWDVVNEALNEDGTLRETVFIKAMGPDYIKKAFRFAYETDTASELYYNDYNLEVKAKRAGAMRIIRALQADGIKINGVGMQGHWELNSPTLAEIEASIVDYSSLGIKVMITELDITVLPNPWNLKGADVNQNFDGSPFMNPYSNSLPDSVERKLAKRYEDIFKLFIKHKDKISRVTFWGVQDGNSWLNDWPIKNRTNYPLLFDRNYRPKSAYKGVLDLVKSGGE